MQTNRWLMGLGVAAGLVGCGDLSLWKSEGGTHETNAPSFPDSGFVNAPPQRLPAEPVTAATPPPAISGGTLSVSPDGKFAVAADPDRDAVYVLRLSDNMLTTAQLARGAEPGRVAFDAAGAAHVVLRGLGSVARVPLAQPNTLSTTKVCDHPRGIAYASADASLAVACASGDLVRLASADHKQLSRRYVDTDLRDVIVNRAGKLLVSRYRSAELLELDADGELVARAAPAERPGNRFSDVTGAPVSMRPALSWRTLQMADDQVLMLHQQAQRDRIQAAPGGYGGFGDCSAISQPAVSTVSVGGAGPGMAMSLGGIALAVDAALSPDQRWLAVAAPSGYLQAQSTIVLYSTVGGTSEPMGPSRPVVFPSDAGVAPVVDAGFAPARDAGQASSDVFANCQFSSAGEGFQSQVTAVAFTPDGKLIVQSREPAQIDIYRVDVTTPEWEGDPGWPTLVIEDTIALDTRSVADTGHDLFHADVGGGITCASCHGEATDDGHVWNFGGVGPRRTQNMRGGLKGTEPFHWDGDMLTFQHLVDDVLTGRMSGFPVELKFASSMVSWIDAQPAIKLPTRDAAATSRGQKLFASAATGCQTCHVGKTGTNNGSFDVGTGGSFQVPALHGLGLRGPYMHDGCATTLRDRFTSDCGGGDRHGKTSQLSAAQLDDLVAYLETL